MPVTYLRNDTTGEFEQIGSGGATTDTTLSQVGKPADAGAVGNALVMKAEAGHSHTLADLGLQYGKQAVNCTANTVSTATVTFSKPYASVPIVTVTAGSSSPGTVVQEVSVSNVTTTGFTICVYRTNTSATTIQWIAAGTVA